MEVAAGAAVGTWVEFCLPQAARNMSKRKMADIVRTDGFIAGIIYRSAINAGLTWHGSGGMALQSRDTFAGKGAAKSWSKRLR